MIELKWTRLSVWAAAAVLLISWGAESQAGRRRALRQSTRESQQAFEASPFESPWGPGITADYGFWAPTGGPWEDLVKTGPTASLGVTWKYADWEGDLLPASSTLFNVNYTHVHLRGDQDVQIFTPAGFAGQVEHLNLNMLEVGATQRFASLMNGLMFFDVGTALGVGGAHGDITVVAPDPTLDQYLVRSPEEDGIFIRGELNSGIGLQFNRVDLRFEGVVGLGGSDALTGRFRAQGDIGARVAATFYLDP